MLQERGITGEETSLPQLWGCKIAYIQNVWDDHFIQFQFSHSVVSDSVTPWTAAHQASLSLTSSWSLLKLMPIEFMMPSNHLILCHPLLLLPSIFPSIGVFSNESVLHIRWQKYWSFSFSISPSSEYSGLISFSMDWLFNCEKDLSWKKVQLLDLGYMYTYGWFMLRFDIKQQNSVKQLFNKKIN